MGRTGFGHQLDSGTGGSCSLRSRRDGVERRCSVPQEHGTGSSECDSAAIPIQEGDAESALRPADRSREWWLGDPQALRCASEVQLLGNGDEVPEFACFEIVHYDSVAVIPVEYHRLVDRYWTHLLSTPTMDHMTTKTALITGANKGIGFAIAHGLGMQGIRVGVGARDDARRQDAVDKLRAAGIDAFGVPLDVTSDDSVAAAANSIADLDILVNNAGISGGDQQNPTTLDIDVLRTTLDTNVFGVIRVTNALLPTLLRSASPRIVNVSSNMGSLALQTGPIMAAYAPSKTMVNAMTVQYARQLVDTAVIVNACCPGYVATDFTGFASTRTPEEGARIALKLATLPDDGPRGGFFDDAGSVAW